MRVLLLTVVLAIFQAAPPIPRQAPNNPAQGSEKTAKQSSPNQPPSIQPTPANNKVTTDGDKEKSQPIAPSNAEQTVGISKLPAVTVAPPKRDWADWSYWGFNLLLVVVGGLQIWLVWRTLGAIKRQADIMDAQKSILEESVKAAEANAVSAEANAIAAKEGAKAANKNIEMFISKERARLKIDLKPLDLSKKQSVAYTVDFTLSNYGATAANISETSYVHSCPN